MLDCSNYPFNRAKKDIGNGAMLPDRGYHSKELGACARHYNEMIAGRDCLAPRLSSGAYLPITVPGSGLPSEITSRQYSHARRSILLPRADHAAVQVRYREVAPPVSSLREKQRRAD